jgi:putative aldouronate transport system permease protein
VATLLREDPSKTEESGAFRRPLRRRRDRKRFQKHRSRTLFLLMLPGLAYSAAGLFKGVVGALLVYAANKVAHRLGEQGVYK